MYVVSKSKVFMKNLHNVKKIYSYKAPHILFAVIRVKWPDTSQELL